MRFQTFRVAAVGAFVLFSSVDAAVAAFFFPTTVPELISDINTANTNGQNDLIDLGNNVFTLTASNNIVDGSNGLPSITEAGSSLTLQNGTVTRSGVAAFRLLHVGASGTLILDNITLSNGLASENGSGTGQGGAIFSRGSLTTTGCMFSLNVASGSNGMLAPASGLGGAVYLAEGTLSESGSTFDSNQAVGGDAVTSLIAAAGSARGGAVYAATGSSIVQILNTVLTSNQAIGGAAAAGLGAGGAAGSGLGGALYFATPAPPVTAQLTSNEAVGGNAAASPFGTFSAGAGHGGAIYADTTTWSGLTDSTVTQNQSRGGSGASSGAVAESGGEGAGAVYVNGATVLGIERVTFADNVAVGGAAAGTAAGGSAFGGAVLVASAGSINSLDSTTFDANEANGDAAAQVEGGAIYNSGLITLSNVTFDSNKAQCATCAVGTEGDGGAIYNAGALSMDFATLSNNVAGHFAGGVFNAGTAFVATTIVSGNTAAAGANNCSGSISDDGYNLSNDATCGFGAGNNVDPKLSASGLQNNGGPTHTILLESDSPALDAIALMDCGGGSDQRGISRPQDGPDADTTALCDIGAVEVTAAASACPSTPASCLEAGKSSLSLKDNADPAKRKLKWKWGKGVLAAVQSDFGDPVGGTPTYTVCLYDQSANVATLETSMTVPGGLCGGETCWKAVSDKGWSFKDKAGSNDGVVKMQLKGGDAGKPQISVGGKGTSLPWPVAFSASELFDQDSNVIVQLHLDSPAQCWSSSFSAAGTKKNDAGQFNASNP